MITTRIIPLIRISIKKLPAIPAFGLREDFVERLLLFEPKPFPGFGDFVLGVCPDEPSSSSDANAGDDDLELKVLKTSFHY